MSDDKALDASSELTELEPLPELPSDGDGELPELPDVPAPPPRDPSAPPPLRELDKAPLHLQKAALIVVCGSLLPWMGYPSAVSSLVAKALVFLAAFFWYQQIAHNWGPKLKGFLGSMAALQIGGKVQEEEKPKRRKSVQGEGPSTLKHPFPTGLHILSLLTVLVACIVLPLVDPTYAKLVEGNPQLIAMAELGMLAWACYTWVHIYNYERWGHFNPLFPLMFLAMLFGGALRGLGSLASDAGGMVKLSGLAGGFVVAIGGGLAAYTIVEAMVAAKKEGDAKKAAQIEARKAARQSRRGS